MSNEINKNPDDNFWNRFLTAQDCGLNHDACLLVAYKDLTLEQALGDMDMDSESEFDPNFVMVEEPEDDSDPDNPFFIPW